MRDLPLDIANTIRPQLGLGGTVNGTARVTGPRDAPDVRFDVRGAGLVSAATRAAGLPPIAVDASGTTANGRLNLRSSVSATGLAATANGSIPLGEGELALDLEPPVLPAGARRPRRRQPRPARHDHRDRARHRPARRPERCGFDLRGEGITASVLAANQVPPFALTASGSYRGGALELAAARATAPGGLDLQGSGRIPFAGPGLDARVAGSLPLSMADPLLAGRSAERLGRGAHLRHRPRVAGGAAARRHRRRWRAGRSSTPRPTSACRTSRSTPPSTATRRSSAASAPRRPAAAPSPPRAGSASAPASPPTSPRSSATCATPTASSSPRGSRATSPSRGRWSAAGACSPGASTSAAPRSRWPRGSAPTPRARSTR